MSFKRLLSLNDIEKDEKGIYHAVSNTEHTNDMDLLVVPVLPLKRMAIVSVTVAVTTINFNSNLKLELLACYMIFNLLHLIKNHSINPLINQLYITIM